MKTIAENLQIIKDSVEDIKQAIIDKGEVITGNITTYANAIRGINSGGGIELNKFNVADNEFLCENDMTWGDFVNSIYNVTHYNPNEYGSNTITISSDSRVRDGQMSYVVSISSDPVLPTDKIIPNGTYYRFTQSGGSTH